MLIFDLDGTLWNTTNTAYKAACIISNEYDDIKEISIDNVRKGMGLSEIENARNYMPYLNDDKALYYLRMIDKKNVELINSEGAILYEGVDETIKRLSKNYKLGIVTNSTNDYAEMFLRVSNLEKYFCDYMGAASYGFTKGEAIKKMIEKNGEPNSFYIGDIKKDMEASNFAGTTFIHSKYGFDSNLDSRLYINRIVELEELLNRFSK